MPPGVGNRVAWFLLFNPRAAIAILPSPRPATATTPWIDRPEDECDGPGVRWMEIYDILMLVILAGATLFGAWKGVAWQVASLASLVLSYLVALRWSEPVSQYFGKPSPWDRFLAMLVLYAVSSLIVWWLFRYVRTWIDRVQLKGFDHQLGALLGAAKGVLWCIGITFFAITLSPTARDKILHARSGYYIAVLLNRADPVIPNELHEMLDPYLKKLEKELAPAASQNTADSDPPRQPVPAARQFAPDRGSRL
ncbi:MAG TPA: CvpA family protein [Pirellulales bacterium]|nr:CvpA family protein [Pirellulales bacterium]